MQTYKQFSPTPFDARGLHADSLDRAEWLVFPASQTRDSGVLDRSNFRSALKALGGESDTVEVHRFGHWGPGWFEIVLVAPDSDAATTAQELADALEDYPVVDESDYSELEWTEAYEYWERCSLRERVDYCRDADASIFAARRTDAMPDRVWERITSNL